MHLPPPSPRLPRRARPRPRHRPPDDNGASPGSDAPGRYHQRSVHPGGWHRASRCPTASCCGPVSRLTRPTRGRNARRALRRPDEPSVRPPDFDLKVKWEAIAANIAELRGEQIISALAEPQAISWLHAQFGKDRVSVDTASADPNGRLRVEITFPTTHTPVAEPAGLAAFVKVLEPADLRTELHSLGQKLVAQYEF